MEFSKDVLESFGNRVNFKYLPNDEPDYDQCWEWLASHDGSGYGRFYSNSKYEGAHRIAYMMTYKKEIPKGICVCHRCDNPTCVNPNHLWLGTIADDIADKVSKDRQASGSINHSKLNEDDIEDILINIYNGNYFNVNQICDIYIIAKNTLTNILIGENWGNVTSLIIKDLGVSLQDLRDKIMMNRRKDLTKSTASQIKKLFRETNLSNSDIAKQFNVSYQTIFKIRSGKTYKDVK